MKKLTYRSAGVDTEKAQQLIGSLKDRIQQTHNVADVGSVIGGIGGFAGVFRSQSDIPFDLVAATDGVGTKLQLQKKFSKLDGIGFDLVGMCVNDLLCSGATPAFFLDYISCGELNDDWYKPVLESVIQACEATPMALIGGETAEHPGIMAEDDFDIAGFAVGFLEKGKEYPRRTEMRAGDIIYSIPSSGLHSNGFSLVRRVLESLENEDSARYNSLIKDPEFIKTLLAPTRIYSELSKLTRKDVVLGIAHNTGGGIYENLPRILPEVLDARIDSPFVHKLSIFDFFREFVEEKELFKTFNMGNGLILVAKPDREEDILNVFPEAKAIGVLVPGNASVLLSGIDF